MGERGGEMVEELSGRWNDSESRDLWEVGEESGERGTGGGELDRKRIRGKKQAGW